MDDAPLRVCLEREIELAGVRIRIREWPGFLGPIVHVVDPFSPSQLMPGVADALAPRYRVLSLEPRPEAAYQSDAADLADVVRMFGFRSPLFLAEGRGSIAALLVAAWQPALVGGVVLVEPATAPPCDLHGLAARGLRDCPPDWNALVCSVTCPLEVLSPFSIEALQTFLATIPTA